MALLRLWLILETKAKLKHAQHRLVTSIKLRLNEWRSRTTSGTANCMLYPC